MSTRKQDRNPRLRSSSVRPRRPPSRSPPWPLPRAGETGDIGPMRPRSRPLLVLAFVLVMAALMYVQAPPSPKPSRALKETAERLKAYYRERPPPVGWKIAGIAVSEGEVWVEMILPKSLRDMPYEAVATALGGQCPMRSDVAWRVLGPDQTIEVRGSAPEGRTLAAVDCRAFMAEIRKVDP